MSVGMKSDKLKQRETVSKGAEVHSTKDIEAEEPEQQSGGMKPVFSQSLRVRPSGAHAIGAIAVGAFALGAFAIGALAVGRLAIGRLRIGRSRLGKLEIEELDIKRIRVGEEITNTHRGTRNTAEDGQRGK